MATKTKTRRLTGGYPGYRAAVTAGYGDRTPMNPTIFYSDREGWTLQSGFHAPDDDEYRLSLVFCSANDGSYYPGDSRLDYERVRVGALAWLAARDSGLGRAKSDEAAEEACWQWDRERYPGSY